MFIGMLPLDAPATSSGALRHHPVTSRRVKLKTRRTP
jgi:hypothetical protein